MSVSALNLVSLLALKTKLWNTLLHDHYVCCWREDFEFTAFRTVI